MYEIIEEIERELVGEFEDLLSGIDLKTTLRNPSVLFSRLTEKISDNLEFYGYLMKASSSANLFVNKDGKLNKCVRNAFASQMDSYYDRLYSVGYACRISPLVQQQPQYGYRKGFADARHALL